MMLSAFAMLLSAFINAPPKECGAIPEVAFDWAVYSRGIDQKGELHESSMVHRRSTRRLVDLDAPGKFHALVPAVDARSICPEDVRWELWVADDAGCARKLTTFVAGEPELDGEAIVVAQRKVGANRRGAPELIDRTTRYSRAGARWAKGATDEQRVRCHHCARWTCTPPPEVERLRAGGR